MTKPKNPREHYQREKERRANDAKPESDLMAAARREYEALLAAQATKGKGGRPKKTPAKRAAPVDLVDDDAIEGEEPGEEATPDAVPEDDAEE